MGEGEIFKVSCNLRRSVLYKHRRQQEITISFGCLGYRESPALWPLFDSWGQHRAFVSSKFPDGDAEGKP